MKLSKSLLSAILIGIVVQTTTSCKKDKDIPDPKAKQEAQKEQEKTNPAEPCPACGMG
ncbi:chryseobasin-related MNIO class RiPP peptide [Terrimonas alba]|uniref:chryseobasin-related MNIO class RiPP peptide n=1 Tax=Terrimonas alba TaxID=3349636 RepID=UPI0035F35EC9